MATKPKALWPREALRGFAPVFLRVDQAAASTVAAARRSPHDWKATPRQKALALPSPRLAKAPPWPHRAIANSDNPANNLTCVCKVPCASTRLPLDRPRLCLPGCLPFARVSRRARFLSRLAASPLGFPLLLSRAQRLRQRRGVPSKQPEGKRNPEFLPPRFPRGVAPSAARTVGRHAALLLWPPRAICVSTPASQACHPPHGRMHSPLPRRKPAFSPPPGLLRSPQHGETAGLGAA